jgi:hypothetical protein
VRDPDLVLISEGPDLVLIRIMGKVRSWSVESKAIDMLIKGGYTGLRMVERSNKKQGSIYIHRDELTWLVGAVEEAVDVDTSLVFWNQSRAGCPSVAVQRRSNRHGRFIIMEEFEGRTRRGSVLIPEGRYGQGWTRLLSELKIARTTLWNGREFRERKVAEKVSDKRTFVEVVSQSKMPEKAMTGDREQYQARPTIAKKPENETCGGCAQYQTRPTNTKQSENELLGERALTHAQTRPKIILGNKQVQQWSAQETEKAGGIHGATPAKTQVLQSEKRDSVLQIPAISGAAAPAIPGEAAQNPAICGAAAQNGGWESKRNGVTSLQARAELQEVLKCLTVIRGQVDLGLKRAELAIQFLEQGESMGRESLDRGRPSETGSWAKPKKKKFKNKSKIQAGLLGSKPKKAPVLDARVDLIPPEKAQYRALARRPEIGESSKMGAARGSGSIPTKKAGNISGDRSDYAGEVQPATVQIMPVIGRESSKSSKLGATRVSGSTPTKKAGNISGDMESRSRLHPGVTISAKETEKVGELVGDTGLDEEQPAILVSSVPESTDQKDGEPLTPMMITQESDSSEVLLSVISETVEGRGQEAVTPMKSSKRGSDHSDYAGDVRSDGIVPEKQAKQIKVFQRRESPLPKVTKSWVAERDSSSKNDSDWLDEDEELGDLGGMGNQEEELGSPISKTLNLVWDVKGTAGISCDGKEGELKEVFGQIVADKYGEGNTFATGEAADDFLGMGDVNGIYEA